jgi:hypothetical protein
MMRPLLLSVAWTLSGAAVSAALFWAFLNTPESTIFTLGVSLILVIAMAAVTGATTTGVMAGWAGRWQQPIWRRAITGAPAILPPAILVAVAWWTVGRGLAWLAAHDGEISAWFIATLDWSDVRPLLNGARLATAWVRTILVPFAALAWLGHLLAHGWHPLWDRASLVRALSPWRLAAVTAIAAATLWAPLTYATYWTPRGLPPTWVEPAVAIVKFSAMALLGAIGLSLITRLAAPDRT